MSDEVNIDKTTFHSRLGNFIAAWKDPKRSEFGGVGSIVVVLGKTEEGPYSKSLALHVRLVQITSLVFFTIFAHPSSRRKW
jgi:nucleosome binding factor SPN SPT16 subunit